MIAVIDIEAVADPAWQPEPDARDPFAPPWAWEVVSIGALSFEKFLENPRAGVFVTKNPDRERGLLERFADYLVLRKGPTLVTWNGRRYDVPVLAMRMLRHGIPAPWFFDRELRKRYTEDGHLDLADHLTDHGAARAMKLSDVAKTIGLPGKMGTDGGDVAGLYAAGELDKIDAYCLADVVQTAFVFLRYERLANRLDLTGYRARVDAVLRVVDGDPRLAELAAAIDRDRLRAQTPEERAAYQAALAEWDAPDASSG